MCCGLALQIQKLILKANEELLKGTRFPGCHGQEFPILINDTDILTEEALCRTLFLPLPPSVKQRHLDSARVIPSYNS